MSQDYKNPAFKKLLQKLQEESWQLELLISGFAIFGLFTALPNIELRVFDAQLSQEVYSFVVYSILWASCKILIFNLLFHVLLRGLWIGALGLRYVSGDIDYDELKYSPKFTKYLKKRVGSFDKYIATLENYCSVIFAISFLLIFYVLAITFTIVVIALIASQIIGNKDLPKWLSEGVGITIMIFFIFGMFFTLIDFITLGFFKKKKWISKFYFPIYWVFSLITLSFLYRPLVYNFLDNKFGKRLSFALVPFYILIALTQTIRYKTSNYFNINSTSTEVIANNNNYEDLLTENSFIDDVAIQSKVITDAYIKVFVQFTRNIEDHMYTYNESLKPKEDKRGLGSNITFNDGPFVNGRKRDSLQKEYLKTFNRIYYVKIDSIIYDSDFIFASNIQNKTGFESYLPTKSLKEGKHVLKVNRMRIRNQDTTYLNIATIPFWYFKD